MHFGLDFKSIRKLSDAMIADYTRICIFGRTVNDESALFSCDAKNVMNFD